LKKLIIPNAITSLNILSGALSVYFVFTFPDKLYLSGLMIFIGALFDFFDGFSARLLKAYSDFGKQLDSLSDLITFGLAPTFIMFKMIQNSTDLIFLPFVSFIIVILSAIRLAIFNITDQKYEFKGLPTPAFAILVASIPLTFKFDTNLLHINILSIYTNIIFLISVTIIFSYLLVSGLKLFSLKFKDFSFKNNKIKYFFLIISTLLIIILNLASFPIIIVFYILMSIVFVKQKNV
jgi:CDP-diacylglycerol--serine O-phosphatidyltransferase